MQFFQSIYRGLNFTFSYFKIFKTILIFFPSFFPSFVSDYDYNEKERKKTKNQTGLKSLKSVHLFV